MTGKGLVAGLLRRGVAAPAGVPAIRRAAAAARVEVLEGRAYFAAAPNPDDGGFAPMSLAVDAPLTAPSVTASTPASGATGVLTSAFVSCEVNVPNGGIDAETLLPANVYLQRDADKARIAAVLNTSGGGDVIVLRPKVALDTQTSYTMFVTSGLKDLAGVSFAPKQIKFKTDGAGDVPDPTIKFEQIQLPTTYGSEFSAVTFGPDGRLYAGTLTGQIMRFDVDAQGVLSTPTIIDSIRTHEGTDRFITGLAVSFRATATNPIIWVSHAATSGLQLGDAEGEDWTGKITRLSGPNLEEVRDRVIHLPRSVRDHLTNQLVFGPDQALYFCQASNTAMGAPDAPWGNRPEHLLNGAILRLDVLKTGLDQVIDAHTEDADPYDPFAPGAPLTIYAEGVRNAFDLVFHSNGVLYAPANGSAAGGATPDSPDDDGDGLPDVAGIPDVTVPETDVLLRIKQGKYYGHPNPVQGHYVLNGGNPTDEVDPYEIAQYPVGTMPDPDYQTPAFDFGVHQSPNGIIEYKSDAFDGKLKGKLLVARYSGGDDIQVLSVAGDGRVTKAQTGITGFTGLNNPVDLVEDTRTGFIYVTELGASAADGKITLIRPVGAVVTPPVVDPPVVVPPVVVPPVVVPPVVDPPVIDPPVVPTGPVSDLSVELSSFVLPVSAVTGQRIKGSLNVRVTNVGDASISNPVDFTVRLTANDAVATTDAEVMSFSRTMKLKPGQAKTLKLKLRDLPTVADGEYRVGVIADASNLLAEKSEANNAVVTDTKVRVSPAFNDIRGVYRTAPAELMAGKKAQAVLDITNAGNVPLNGRYTVNVYASADQTPGAGDVILGTYQVRLKMAAGGTKGVKMKFLVPADVAAANYFLVTDLDVGNLLPESDKTNNTVSAGPLALVASPT